MKKTADLELGHETLVAFVSKVVMATGGLVSSIIFARVLGSDGLGIYWTALSAAFILSVVPAGIGTAIQKRVSEIDVAPETFFGTGLAFHAVYSATVLGIFVAVRPFAVDFFGSAALAFGTVGVVVSLGLFNVVNRAYAGIGYPGMSSWMDTVRTYVMLGIQLLFLWLGYGAWGVLAGFVLGTFVSAIVSLFAAGVVPALPNRDASRRIWSFARWSVPNNLLDSVYNRSDVLLLRAVVGVSSAGLYTAALQLTQPATYLSGSISDALQVKSSGVDSVEGDVKSDLANSVSYVGLFAIPMFFGAVAMPRSLMVTFFGGEFSAGWSALVGLAVYQVFNVYRTPFEAVIEGTDRPELVTRVNAITLGLYLPTAYVAGTTFGLNGIVAVTAGAEGIRFTSYQVISRTEFGGVVLPRPVLDQIASGAFMFGTVSVLVGDVVPITSWLWLVVVVGTGAAVYFAVLLIISSHFRLTLSNTLGPYFPALRSS